MEKSKQLIIITAIMFLLSAIWLSYVSQKQMDPDYQKNWWVLYFENPKSELLTFAIENHSDNENFHWEILTNKTKASEGDISIKKGAKKTIPISATGMENKKITIRVIDGEDKKEIYKSL